MTNERRMRLQWSQPSMYLYDEHAKAQRRNEWRNPCHLRRWAFA